ncbi:hypothetical protein [Aequorivita sp. CIP111184]|uniref:hypothetical protein n=1 Tax=Aequorivita sp. CIP111184 TaxID=2211356 RepID=UPI000DBBBDE4|nr:hypothetical protein [Aequorivita sp. CIP111184]SRX54518.1 hypothetical protein AEQU1_01529 [Aequorivita sp. CIP111184]
MGQKKDIGALFENKLNDGKKIPNKSLWEKINTSLDEEKRRKKRILFYWLIGGGVSVLLGLVLMFGSELFLHSNLQTQENKNSLTEENNTYTKKESLKTVIENLKVDSLNFKKNGDEKLFRNPNALEIRTANEIEKSSQIDSENKTKKSTSKKNNIDETYTVSKKYYYYNSKDGKQIVTNSKSEIDSLILKEYKSSDTTATKKNDSLE